MTPQDEWVLARKWIRKYKDHFPESKDEEQWRMLRETLTCLVTDAITDFKREELVISTPVKIIKSEKYALILQDKNGKYHYFTHEGTYDGWSMDTPQELN